MMRAFLALVLLPLNTWAAEAQLASEGAAKSDSMSMSETVNTAVNAAVSSPSANLIPIALIFFIFYHALIKPQRKQAERHETLIRLLKKGDEVMTIGGMVGKVTKVGSDDKINLEIAKGVEITMLKSSVTAYADGSHPAIADKKAKKTSAKMGEKNDNVVPSRNNVANDN